MKTLNTFLFLTMISFGVTLTNSYACTSSAQCGSNGVCMNGDCHDIGGGPTFDEPRGKQRY